MIVLANDGLGKEGIERFEKSGIEIDIEKKLDLIESIGNYDGLIVRSATKVTRDKFNTAVKEGFENSNTGKATKEDKSRA